jgi:hypothetical protein
LGSSGSSPIASAVVAAPRAPIRIAGAERLARKPVLALLTSGGQLLGMHAGPPPFTLFDDRSVVARRSEGVVEGELAADAYAALLAEVAQAGLDALPPRVTGGVESTHSIDTSIVVRAGDGYLRVQVVGFDGGAMQASPIPREPPPGAFVRLHARLTSLPIPGARPWVAKHALATLRRVERLGEPWPATIPPPDDACFRPAGDDTLLHCVVELGQVEPFRRACEAKDARPVFRSNERAYELAHFAETIDARAFLDRVDRCADPEAARDPACASGR